MNGVANAFFFQEAGGRFCIDFPPILVTLGGWRVLLVTFGGGLGLGPKVLIIVGCILGVLGSPWGGLGAPCGPLGAIVATVA